MRRTRLIRLVTIAAANVTTAAMLLGLLFRLLLRLLLRLFLAFLLHVLVHLREEKSRVENCQERNGDEHEGAVEDEEAGFVLHDVVAPAAGHFSDTVIYKVLGVYLIDVRFLSNLGGVGGQERTGRCNG